MFKTVPHEIKYERIEVCKKCELFSKKLEICTSCGCYIPAKATFAGSECPEGKWTASTPGESLINKIEELILESWNK